MKTAGFFISLVCCDGLVVLFHIAVEVLGELFGGIFTHAAQILMYLVCNSRVLTDDLAADIGAMIGDTLKIGEHFEEYDTAVDVA